MASSRKFLLAALPQTYALTRYSFIGLLVALSSLAGKLYLQGQGILVLQLFLLLGFLQGCMMFALPAASKITLKALAIYIATASLPVIASTAQDRPISLSFTSTATPVLKVLGYPVTQSGQTILLQLPLGGMSSFYLNAACAGPASYSIFLFLNGLMILDFNVERKFAVASAVVGIAVLYMINLLRIVLLVHTTYFQGEAAGATMHLYIGYVLFSIFYLVYIFLFIRCLPTGHSTSRGS